jgi:light-regulated signal transduction histidine kinase (bacteriophytochrome)
VITKGKPFAGPSPGEQTHGTSLLAVPVKSKETVVGLLAAVKGGPDVYTETHLRLLESIANLTEIAMEKAMLYEDTVNKAREIESRNKELDEFTYVVSHDLKEPLISIEGFSKILLKDYQDTVDQEGKEYLATVVQATNHMKYLIDDLLTLSRVGHVKESVELVSCGDVVMEILHDIQFTLRAKNVAVNVEPNMPQVRYNRTQLGMVFRNLISNAMKFNDKPQPTIDISIRDEGGQYVLSVRDNGIGIDERYYDRIFMIFQRLQRKEDYEGTGAGLTIVKKIVESHHGRIWVDSVVGEGTTFSFTIPK